MNWLNKPARTLIAASLCLASGAANAGRACEETVVDPAKTQIAFDTALTLGRVLDASGQKLVILARRGQDLEKYGVTFSHAAFAAREADGWAIYHDLNVCGSALSKLFVQGLAEFLADDLISQDVAVVTPEPWLQDRLIQVLASKQEQFRMHESAYSAVAYPFALRYQNSNGWILETYARAASETLLPKREEAQGWLKSQGYTPSIIELGTLTRLGARMFKANVAFDDQPSELRWAGKITASTGDSVLRFVAKNGIKQPGCTHGKFAEAVCLVKNQ
jgi:hypothetical protein